MNIFEQDMNSIESVSGVFTVTITDNWSINGNPNGGYLLALMTDAMLNQKEKIRALATFAGENNECVISRYETTAAPLAPRESCVHIPLIPRYTLYDQLDVLLDPECAGWMQNKLTDKSENKGWIRFKSGAPYDLLSVLLIADSLPPAVMATYGMMAWVPTIELSVNIRNLPQSMWLNCSLRTRFITCGLLEADGEVWDEAGNLVAISRQIAQVKKL